MKNVYGSTILEEANLLMMAEFKKQEKNISIKLELRQRKVI